MHITTTLVLTSTALLAVSTGCMGSRVALRRDGSPGPQECPEESKRAMRHLGLRVGDSVLVNLDANQLENQRVTLHDGPIESATREEFGPLAATSRLYGQVWTSGSQVVLRYYEAQSNTVENVPLCAEARLGYDQMRKLPESKPGTAILKSSVATAFIVEKFR